MTNNNILIGAEGIDGANFLASCLTMSDKVYFNDGTLEDKKEFFFNRMNEISKMNGLPIWTDVSMLYQTCARYKSKILLGTNQSKYKTPTLDDKSLISKVCLPLFWPITNLNTKNTDDPLVKLFESKYFIGLINPDLFMALRMVLDRPCPWTRKNLDLTTITDFNLLTKKIKKDLKNTYRTDIDRLFDVQVNEMDHIHHKWEMLNMKCDIDRLSDFYPETRSYKVNSEGLEYYTSSRDRIINIYKRSNELLKSKITHEWDCNWFLTEEETVKNLDLLYFELNLGKCNEELVRSMYKVWIHKIDTIKKTYIKEFLLASINNDTVTT